jgi:hypothetical protein
MKDDKSSKKNPVNSAAKPAQEGPLPGSEVRGDALVVDVPKLLAGIGVADTPENRDMVCIVLERELRRRYPRAEYVETNTCRECAGAGQVILTRQARDSDLFGPVERALLRKYNLPVAEWTRCTRCQGSGQVTVKANIPAALPPERAV